MDIAGSVAVQVKADISHFEKGLAEARQEATRFDQQASRSLQSTDHAARQLGNAADQASTAINRMTTAGARNAVVMTSMERGATAASWQMRNLQFQLIDIAQGIPLAFQSPLHAMINFANQGSQIAQIYGPEEGGVGRALRESAAMAGSFIARIAPFAAVAGAAALAIGGMTAAINENSSVTVTWGDTALAVVQVVRDAFYDMLKPAIDAVAPWFASAWDIVVSTTKETANNLVRLVLGSFEIIKAGVMNLPDAFIVAGEAAANGFLEAMRQMVQKAVTQFNILIKSVQRSFAGTPLEALAKGLPTIDNSGNGGPFSRSKWQVDIGGAAARARIDDRIASRNGAVSDIMSTDYMGRFFDAVEQKAIANALRDTEEAAKGAGKAMKDAANDNEKPWEKIAEEIAKAKEALGQDFGGILRGLVDGTMEWKDALIQAGQAILKYFNQINIAQGGQGLFGGGFLQGLLGALFGFRDGGAFVGGNVVPFARGGIVSRPTLFPMANGAGLMGEAGPEAIMPLRRGPDGKLGVAAMGGGAPTSIVIGGSQIIIQGDANEQQRDDLKRILDERDRELMKQLPKLIDKRTNDRNTRGVRA